MNSEWAEHSVGDLFELINGYAFKSSDFKNCGIPVIKIKNVKAGAFIDDNFDFVDPDFLISRSDKQPKQGDLLITMSGNRHDGSRETWVGKVSWFNQGKNYLVNQRVGILRLRDSGGFNARFLAYQLSSDAFQDHFIAVATSSGGQANLSPNQIKEMILRIPGKKIQDQIATILGEIEDKIDLNRRINQTLEAMAQAIFKSWFVDFDPVKAKITAIEQGEDPLRAAMRVISGKTDAELDQMPREHHDQLAATAALFPDAMAESELGEIPKGWEASTIGEMVEIAGGATPDTKNESYWNPPEHFWTSPKDLSGAQSPVLLTTERKISTAGLSRIGSGLLPKGTLLMSSRAPIGYLAITQMPVAINQGYIAMLPGGKLSPLYLLMWCQQNMEEIKGQANGSTFMEISKKAFRPMLIINPGSILLDRFLGVVAPLFGKLVEGVKESSQLAELRDTLLPKLLSGELAVPSLEE